MHAACKLCAGACCESLVIARPVGSVGDWLAHHGLALTDAVELPTPCGKLGPCGECTIWHDRPEPCHTYPVGGKDCRETVLRRRAAIADDIIALLP